MEYGSDVCRPWRDASPAPNVSLSRQPFVRLRRQMKLEMQDEDTETDDQRKDSRTNRPAQALCFIFVFRMNGEITF